jgi:hypothetical protein
MSQVFADSPGFIYRILDSDTEFSGYIGNYKLQGGQTLNAISVNTPGQDIPRISDIHGIECVIHDVSDVTRSKLEFITDETEVLVNTWKVFLICWDPATGEDLNNAAHRIMELFKGSTSIQTVKTSEGARARAQTLVLIPADQPLSSEGMAVFGPEPAITLNATALNVAPGASVDLSWTLTETTSATMDQGVGAIATTGTTSVIVDRTTTYTIAATNEFSTKAGGIEIIVLDPAIETFLATPTGNTNEYTLSWTTSLAQEIRLDGRYDWPTSGSTTVTVSTPTTFTLEAESTQSVVTQTLTITP